MWVWWALALVAGAPFALAACGGDGGDAADTAGGQDVIVADVIGPDPQCEGQATGVACDDGNACTSGDKCIDERCRGAQIQCGDGDPCTDDRCDLALGCVHEPNTASCDDDNACTVQDTCGVDGCAGRPVSDLACGDGDPCTTNDTCDAGVCRGVVNDCNDLNPCTQDFCQPGHPEALPGSHCVHLPLDGACDDTNPCTTQDACVEGACVGTPNPGALCSDGDLCTEGETCQEDGSCGAGEARECFDDNPCTLDLCDAAQGCRFPPDVGEACDDDDLCTLSDSCDPDGLCVGTPRACQPDDQCVVGVCDPSDGECVVTAKDCDDGNPCTNDSCEPAVGCVHTARSGGCDDGSLCTSGDVCVEGECVGTATVCDAAADTTCRKNLCQPETGACELTHFNGVLCDDGDLCTGGDICAGGECVGVAFSCTDGDPCTEDWCDGASGECVHDTLSEEECGDLALERSNQYRDLVGLPLLKNHEAIIDAATAHCLYYVNNPEPYDAGLSPHNEEAGLEGFTGVGFGARMAHAGYTGSPMFEVMAFLNDPVKSVDEWIATLYHRIPFVVPRAWEMGYGAAQKGFRRCDTIDFAANPDTDPAWEGLIIPFPPDGHTGVPTRWHGAENPQPPLPNPYPSGPILTVTFAQQQGYPGVSIVDSDIHGPDGPIPHVANSPLTDGDLCCGVITLYPNAPIAPFTTYTVVVDYSRNGVPGTLEWSFTTGNDTYIYFLP